MTQPQTKCPHGCWLSSWDVDGKCRYCSVCYQLPGESVSKEELLDLVAKWDKILRATRLSMAQGMSINGHHIILMDDRPYTDEDGDWRDSPLERAAAASPQTELQEAKERETMMIRDLAEEFMCGSCTMWAAALGLRPEQVQRLRSQLAGVEREELEAARKTLGMSDKEWTEYRLLRLISAARSMAAAQTKL